MSLDCTKWAWVQIEAGRCETLAQTLVLLKIADMSHDNGLTWAGAAYLASRTGLNERTVRQSLQAMDGRLLTIKPRPGRSPVTRLLLTPFTYQPPTEDEIEDRAPRGRPKTPEFDDTGPGIDDKTPELSSDDTVIETPRTVDISGAGDLFGGLPLAAKPPPIDVDAAFDEWWAHYPRKVSKGAARAAFEKALGRINDINPIGILTAGVISLARECEGKDPQFTPHAATWLNQDGFYDETGARRPDHDPRSDARVRDLARNAGRIDALREGAENALEEFRRRRGRGSPGGEGSGYGG